LTLRPFTYTWTWNLIYASELFLRTVYFDRPLTVLLVPGQATLSARRELRLSLKLPSWSFVLLTYRHIASEPADRVFFYPPNLWQVPAPPPFLFLRSCPPSPSYEILKPSQAGFPVPFFSGKVPLVLSPTGKQGWRFVRGPPPVRKMTLLSSRGGTTSPPVSLTLRGPLPAHLVRQSRSVSFPSRKLSS